MASAERIESLQTKHARLQMEIDTEAHRPHPDETHLAALKREKLRVKDEIERMRRLH